MDGYVEKFNGRVRITVHFRNAGEYLKFRQHVMKTNWMVGMPYPQYEFLVCSFVDYDEFNEVSRKIVNLLQMGFDVYTANWTLDKKLFETETKEFRLEKDLAEEMSPEDDEPEDDEWFDKEKFLEILRASKFVT